MIAQVLALVGALLILVAAVGVSRFGDVLARMHSLSKASTLGLIFVLAGGVVGLRSFDDVSFVLLAGALQVLTSPVGANLIARATYRAEGIPHQVDSIDELADREGRHQDPHGS